MMILYSPPMTIPERNSSLTSSRTDGMWWLGLLAATAFNCVFQIAWFWRFRGHNITMDGICYIGLARHLLDGNIKASLHGYWSPLMSWMIAVMGVFSKNFTLLARLATILGFILCLPLLYRLTRELWHSRVAAALAVFWFSTARGIMAEAVGSILADFLLTACVLLYSILLLAALRRKEPRAWIPVGAAHALAFLAKAIAMPWLAITTVLAAVVQNMKSLRRLIACMLLAFVLPFAVWFAWGMTLRTKYGVFTTGYQLRQNLMINWRRTLSHFPRGDNRVFSESSSAYDNYMVGEVSWSDLQSFNMRNPALLRMIVTSEVQNLPLAVKEILVLLTPGGVLALLAMAIMLLRQRSMLIAETDFVGVSLAGAVPLLAAYCMLVFDARYVIPLVAVLISICCPALLPPSLAGTAPRPPKWIQRILLALFVTSTIFFAVYWASPFRTVDRDFEASCYQAAAALRADKSVGALVSIGNGPYPDHGVGFEAGPYVSYLAGWRLVGFNAQLPEPGQASTLVSKVLALNSDAVAVWGSPTDPVYVSIVASIAQAPDSPSANSISDPHKGEVGTLFLRRQSGRVSLSLGETSLSPLN